jgi:hypothetical protein
MMGDIELCAASHSIAKAFMMRQEGKTLYIAKNVTRMNLGAKHILQPHP